MARRSLFPFLPSPPRLVAVDRLLPDVTAAALRCVGLARGGDSTRLDNHARCSPCPKGIGPGMGGWATRWWVTLLGGVVSGVCCCCCLFFLLFLFLFSFFLRWRLFSSLFSSLRCAALRVRYWGCHLGRRSYTPLHSTTLHSTAASRDTDRTQHNTQHTNILKQRRERQEIGVLRDQREPLLKTGTVNHP